MRVFIYQMLCVIAEIVISFVKGSPCTVVANQWVESWATESIRMQDLIEELEKENLIDLSQEVATSEPLEVPPARTTSSNFDEQMARLVADIGVALDRRINIERNDGMAINSNDPTWKIS